MIGAFLAAMAVCQSRAIRPERQFQRRGHHTENSLAPSNQPAESLATINNSAGITESSSYVAHFAGVPHSSALMEEQVGAKVVLVSGIGLKEYITVTPDEGYGSISQDVQYATLSEELLTLPIRRPQSFNVLVATVKTWLADFIVQLTEIRSGAKAIVDWKRSLAFALFGFFYVGLVQWVLYVTFMAYLAPSAIVFSNEPMRAKLHDWPGQVDLVKQVMIDNFFLAALIYFPVFYMLKEFVNTGCSHLSSLPDGLRRYRGNFVSDNMLSMLFWLPGDLIAFAAPMYMRLPLDHAVSFGWTMVLSYRRGGAGPTSKASGAAAAAK